MLEEKKDREFLDNIQHIDQRFYEYFKNAIELNDNFNRNLVSFQGNKLEPCYRWYKYKEAFSSKLVKYLLKEFQVSKGIIFDPFAGIGTTLFSACELGYDSEGIELLPIGRQIIESRFNSIHKITSPPYCNRYDYTRTYALELSLLGIKEDQLIQLRQEMLSCTVENKEKQLLSINNNWNQAINLCEENKLLQTILSFLKYKKDLQELNNNGIPRMVKGYFYEMACIIQECYRVLRKNGFMFMINDNVRYAGASISVDLILSKIAEDIGFSINKIFVLPNSKGNSSQQMGNYGQEKLRKCVYVWIKND